MKSCFSKYFLDFFKEIKKKKTAWTCNLIDKVMVKVKLTFGFKSAERKKPKRYLSDPPE